MTLPPIRRPQTNTSLLSDCFSSRFQEEWAIADSSIKPSDNPSMVESITGPGLRWTRKTGQVTK